MICHCAIINLDQLNQYMENWIDRVAALARLGVRQQTLYAYVSRGRIGVRSDPEDSRRSLYNANDIEDLRTRRSRGRGRAAVASSAMSWGEPSLETAISTVHQGRLIYRGTDASLLARTAAWEDAAELLWQAGRPVSLSFSADEASGEPFAVLAALVPGSYPGLGRSRDRLFVDGEAAISRLAEAFGAAPIKGALDQRLASGWSLNGDCAAALRRALVLLADHELNASTFSVRVAASTGAPVAACLLAGLSALTGPRHGGAGAAALALLGDAERRGPAVAVRQTLTAHRHLPGFGHPLYPLGDPRAAALFEILPGYALADDLCAEVENVCGLRPNIDFALAVLTRLGNLPDDASFRLFALGRSIGWVAHAVEQFGDDKLIRPRAQYTGVLPE